MTNETPQVVTIAGSDSGGCAGLQADLKTFQNRHAFGMSIIVALTAQNTLGVQEAYPIPNDFVTSQFASMAADYQVRSAKTGMLASPSLVETVAKNLKQYDFGPLVVDPVMIAKGGHALLEAEAVQTVKDYLLPLATVLTPNMPEAEVFLGYSVESAQDMIKAALDLKELGPKNVIIKGGHGHGAAACDYVLLEDESSFWMASPRIDTINTHGTGDTFSACIAAELAKGTPLKEAILIGKAFIQAAIADPIAVGHGHGPVNHWVQELAPVTWASSWEELQKQLGDLDPNLVESATNPEEDLHD